MEKLFTTLRTHTCGALNMTNVAMNVTLCGWVQITRDFGKFIFIDLRDRYGITQIRITAESQPELYAKAKRLGREYVIMVKGFVKERENRNSKMPTGDIEILPSHLEILNVAELPPFKIENETDGGEELRLQYRYLDLRRPTLAQNLIQRAQIVRSVRNYLEANGFLDIETPNLIKSTPEGARDFIVPSRLQKGSFYALPQSPQILKQLLMVAGMDRYYQICKCYRDEDFRGDRQPEFTQIDCEMSFVQQEDILTMFDGMIRAVFKDIKNINLPHLPSITYREAMDTYGSDKPDLRFGMPIIHVEYGFLNMSGFPPFKEAAESNGWISGIVAPGCANFTRKQLDALTDFVKAPHRGCKGLFYVQCKEDGTFKSSADKYFTPELLASLAHQMHAQPGDLILIVADKASRARKALGDLRLEIAQSQNMIPADSWSVFFVVDFPLYEADEETGQLMSVHHPFVMPHPEDLHKLDSHNEQDLLNVRAQCYDMVINGNEIMSGSIRIHRRDIQEKVFNRLGLSEEEKQLKFGFMLRAFEYGAPPHGGCAFGLDRLAMLIAGGDTIRDVIAFPKNSSGRDVMLDAPGPVDAKALKDVGVTRESTVE